MTRTENTAIVRHNRLGRFSNPWDSWQEKRLKAAYYLLTNKPSRDVWPSPREPQLDIDLPLKRPVFGPAFADSESENGVRLTWLGHATVFFNIDGLNILCDPIFSSRCAIVGPKRYRPPPCDVNF